LISHLDDLSIEGWVGISNSLNAELVMLTVSPSLGTLIPENGSHIVEPYWLGEVMHPVFHIGAAHRGSPLGAQCDLVSAFILKGVHLFLNDVGILADAAHKETSILESGGIDASVAIKFADSGCFLLDKAPASLLWGQYVRGTSGGLIQ
jgi:hypothetical protein